MLTEADCKAVVAKKALQGCRDLEYNWLGTDDQGRDVVARLIYGFRISVLFGLALTIVSSIIGIAAGGVQGYFGGWIDLGFQRFIEVWSAIPSLYLLLILSSVLVPGFFVLLGILLLFSWVSLVGLVRAEFLRGRNFEYIMAARSLGVSNARIMIRHLLPNAMVATMTFLPFIVSSSVMTLTALDFLGFGLPPGSPSLGELLAQGKANVQAPWLGFTGFFAVADHAVAANLHRRRRARCLRPAQDVPVGSPHGHRHPAPPLRPRSCRFCFITAVIHPPLSIRSPTRSSAASAWLWSASPGSGKSVSALSILKLLPYPTASHPSGSVRFNGPRAAESQRERDSRHSRQRHLDYLPGADDVAQSAANH